MNLSLKNVKFSESLSEETNAFTADLFLDNKKIAYVRNSGRGGNTSYGHYDGMKEILKDIEAYTLTLPEIDFGTFTSKSDLESIIDNLFEAWLEAKEAKKLEKNMDKGIMYGTKREYHIITWSKNTITSLLKTPQGTKVVKDKLASLKKEGHTILNTNLDHLIHND